MDQPWVQYQAMLSGKKQGDTEHHMIIRDMKFLEIRAASKKVFLFGLFVCFVVCFVLVLFGWFLILLPCLPDDNYFTTK